MNTIDEKAIIHQHIIEKEKKKKKKTYYQIGCNGYHRTNVTLIKCTDSYYCPECMKKLGKQKYKKEK